MTKLFFLRYLIVKAQKSLLKQVCYFKNSNFYFKYKHKKSYIYIIVNQFFIKRKPPY